MTDITFGTAPVPALRSGRNAEPNPFTERFPTPEGQALTVTLDGNTEANKETITSLTGKARRAAAAMTPPMTARVQAAETETGTGKNKRVQTVLSIWTVEKIVRQTSTPGQVEAVSA